jgi:hypothetical protein
LSWHVHTHIGTAAQGACVASPPPLSTLCVCTGLLYGKISLSLSLSFSVSLSLSVPSYIASCSSATISDLVLALCLLSLSSSSAAMFTYTWKSSASAALASRSTYACLAAHLSLSQQQQPPSFFPFLSARSCAAYTAPSRARSAAQGSRVTARRSCHQETAAAAAIAARRLFLP